MKTSPEELKTLRCLWYSRLKESGFEDIEKFVNDELVLIVPTSAGHSSQIVIGRIDYFLALEHLAKDETTWFRNEIDKHILIRYSEGARICKIVNELKSTYGVRMDRKTIRIMIRRYEVAWNLKKYTRKQLNLKSL